MTMQTDRAIAMEERSVDTITGTIASTTSAPTNGAPVIVGVQTETGMEAVPFDRRSWNAFYHDHVGDGGVFPADLAVEIIGDSLWDASVACTDPDCPNCLQPLLMEGSLGK